MYTPSFLSNSLKFIFRISWIILILILFFSSECKIQDPWILHANKKINQLVPPSTL